MVQFNPKEVNNKIMSHGIVVKGATVSEDNEGNVYFISAVYGSAIEIKDSEGNAIISNLSTHRFYPALQLEKGFEVTGTDLSVRYATSPALVK